MKERKWPYLFEKTSATVHHAGRYIAFIIFLCAPYSLQADDVELYLSPPAVPLPSNILFVIDESNEMADDRVKILKSALLDKGGILHADISENIKAAIMAFNSSPSPDTDSGDRAHLRVLSDFNAIGDKNKRSKIAAAVAELTPEGRSPTVQAINAAVRWFTDGYVESQASTIKEYPSPVKAVQNRAKENWCRSNAMVLLTAGSPDRVGPETQTDYQGVTCDTTAPFSSAENQPGLCAQEIAQQAYSKDLMPEDNYPGWKGKQHVVTHTAGIQTTENSEAENFLKNIAYRGGGKYYPAQTAIQIRTALRHIINEVNTSIPYSYTAPSVPYNPDRSTISGNFIYVPVFRPEVGRFWKGNLLKYKTGLDKDGARYIHDQNNNTVFKDGFMFRDEIQDYWSTPGSTGNGVSSKMSSAATRKLYSWLDGEDKDLTRIPAAASISPNRVHANNSKIHPSMLGVSTADERLAILNWVNWQYTAQNIENKKTDTDMTSSNKIMPMAAPLHTKPAVAKYQNNKDVVLINTTDGILHAFNAGGETAGGGDELWAFIPQPLLADLATLKRNPPSSVPNYGLDGPLIVYDTIDNGVARKFAVFGARRGGRSLYALDISERTAPRLAWQINGGHSAGFERLGQTWSIPRFLKMELNGGTVKEVLVFGGGYDPAQDRATSRTDDNYGNAVYVIDAISGERLAYFSADTEGQNSTFSLQIAAMKNGIIGFLPVDINSNGITDRLYATDVGGRIFRIDIPDSGFTETAISGGVIADINMNGEGYQRFFTTPEVAYYSRGGEQFLAILVGSGFLPRPLSNTVTNRFYMLKDPAIWSAPRDSNGDISYSSASEDDLYNASDNQIQQGSITEIKQAHTQLAGKRGWYIDLIDGGAKQKVFSKVRIFNSIISFISFQAERSSSEDICTATSSMGHHSIYAIRLLDGTAALDINDDGELDASDRSKTLPSSGLPAAPLVVSSSHNGDTDKNPAGSTLIGLENIYQLPDRFLPLSWEEVIDQYPPTRRP
ncbi:MAG: pilus assembly protein [Arenicellales bacterium]